MQTAIDEFDVILVDVLARRGRMLDVRVRTEGKDFVVLAVSERQLRGANRFHLRAFKATRGYLMPVLSQRDWDVVVGRALAAERGR